MELKEVSSKKTEIGIIPADWDLIRLGDVLVFKNGLNKESEFFGYGTPIVNYMDVYANYGLTKDNIQGKVFVSNEEIKNFSANKGDVFFTRTSETVNEIGISAVLLEDVKKCVFSGFVLRGRDKSSTLSLDFKKYCFSSYAVRKQIISRSTYTTRTLTNGRHLSAVYISIPKDQEEQQAIATALSDVDTLITNLDKLIAKKKAIKQGAMQRLLKSPAKGGQRLPGFEGEWEAMTMKDISWVNQGLQIAIEHRYDYQIDGSKVYITIQHLNEGKAPEYILNYSDSVLCSRDDVLMTRTGNTGIVITNVEGIFHNNFFKINYDRRKVDKDFLVYFLSFPPTQREILERAGTSTIPDLNHDDFYSLPISLPELKEQELISSILSDMDREIESLETKKSKYLSIKQGMMQELLTGKTRLV